jgi:autotransporter strand-loop-strand O-heptosyltransferase
MPDGAPPPVAGSVASTPEAAESVTPAVAPTEAAAPAAASAAAEPASETPPMAATEPLPAAGASGPAQKPAYPPASEAPTQEGPQGLRFDFNDGCRVLVPEGAHPWRVRLFDLDTGNIVFETSGDFAAGRINSTKRYYIRFRVEAWAGGEQVLNHEYDAENREVMVIFPVGTIGDTMGWFPYAVKFQRRHRCKLTCAMAERLIPLFKDAYPEIEFTTHEDAKPERYYATYKIGLFFTDKDRVHQPCDFRMVGLHRTAGYILGVDPTEEAPTLGLPDEGRPIKEPYVVIATQSTTQCKYWNNPMGWHEIVAFLKENGYRVMCIDQKPVHGTGIVWNHIPHGVEDETGDRALAERVRWMRHADFFIGLTSGLSWLAWAAGTPVVMIAGFTHPTNEFYTPYRVINYHACNGCWNDPEHQFDHHDFLYCPRHKNTPRQFECTRLITADQVKQAIRRIPGFGKAKRAKTAA